MIRTKYKDLTIEVFDDSYYKENSADNSHHYNIIYGYSSEFAFTSLHGVKIYDVNDKLLRCVAIANTGGATRIQKNSFIISYNFILICCCDTIFCLELPLLELKWQKVVDSATCFEIFKCNDDFIVRGEMEISRINIKGEIIWQFSGKDIFVTETGKDDFSFDTDEIRLKDWSGNTYQINIKTGEGSLLKREAISNTFSLKKWLKNIFLANTKSI